MDLGLGKTAGAQGAAEADIIKNATTATFAKDVIEASRKVPVIVDFWAAWCGPCKQLTPILEKVVRSYKGKVRLVKVNVDENQALAGQLRVQSLPTVYAFRDGRPLDGFMGAQPESAVKAFVDRLLGDEGAGDLAAALEHAEKALEAGDLQGAAEIYAAVLQEEPQNVAALAGLAKCYLQERRPRARRADHRPGAARQARRGARRQRARRARAGAQRRQGRRRRRAQGQGGRPIPPTIRRASTTRWRWPPRGNKTRGARPAARERAPRPQVERGGGAQAARPAVRRLGSEGSRHARRPAPAVVHPVLLKPK